MNRLLTLALAWTIALLAVAPGAQAARSTPQPSPWWGWWRHHVHVQRICYLGHRGMPSGCVTIVTWTP